MKLKISEWAKAKRVIEQDLYSNSWIVIEHIAKLVCMPNHDAVNHWETEIYAHIKSVPLLSGKNKYPKSEQIYEWTWGVWCDSMNTVKINNIIDDIEYEYGVTVTMTVQQFQKKLCFACDEYFTWLSNKLSENGSVGIRKVYEKLDSLIGK